MLRYSLLAIATLAAVFDTASCHAEEPLSLMGMIAEWQYPASKINGATLSDAATKNEARQRTRPSIQYKTVLTTADSMAKVIEYYETKLKETKLKETALKESPRKPVANSQDSNMKSNPAKVVSRSVTTHDDSENRPLAIHVILVNTNEASTTLVISRAETESETHIAWTHYLRL